MSGAEDRALVESLGALTAPGGQRSSTIPGTVRPTTPAPKGWEPGVAFAATGGMVITTPAQFDNVARDEAAWAKMIADLGLEIPPGFHVRLTEVKFDEGAWARDAENIGKPHTAYRKAAWRYRFAVEPDSARIHADDVDGIIREVVRAKRKRLAAPETTTRCQVVVYADPQAGKVALLGGTEALAGRFRDCLDMLDDHRRDLRKVGRGCDEAAWLDGGDCIEGFENVKSQAQTNDLTLTQQVRAHRRFTMTGLTRLAGQYGKVTAATCGSNHARVRAGKDPLATADDDWGIEILSQVQDAFALNPDTYGGVQFAYPPAQRETVSLNLAGLTVGLAHGHQANKPEAMVAWWKQQAFGNQPVTAARVLVTAHYHHWATKEVGDGRLWVQSPTLDGGSDWWTQRSGEMSNPGLMVFSVSEHGWDDLRILRPWGTEGLREGGPLAAGAAT